ncbi:MAG TPA: tetratricopeptide repeat protein [candidate division Zixibacteria bacterium]|nr:tetratricopeptide repeat protein [candidate division Zixibacteria bacterium]
MEEGLVKVENLIKAHKHAECFEAIEEMEKLNNLTKAQKKKISSYKVNCYIGLRKFSEAYAEFDQAIEKYTKEKNWELVLENYTNKIRTKFNEGKNEDALKLIEEGFMIIDQTGKLTTALIEKKGELIFWKGHIYLFSNNKDEALKYLQEAIDFAEKNNLDKTLNHAKHRLGNLYSFLGEYEIALQLTEEAYNYFNEKNDKFIAAGIIHNLGVTYAEVGEYKKSRECFEKKAEIVDPTPHDIAAIGDSYWREGDIEKGIEEMEKGLEKIRTIFKNGEKHSVYQFIQANLFLRIGKHDEALELYNDLISRAQNNLGYPGGFYLIGIAHVYYHKGELDTAIDYAQRALDIAEKANMRYGVGYGHFILGKIYIEKGETEKALHHLQSSLDLRLAMGNKNDLSLTFRELITFLLDNESLEDVDEYFDQLEQIASTTDSRVVRHNYLLSKALILKSKGRPKYWTQAIDILEKIVSEKISDYNTLLVALINLCEILLNEFSISGVQEVLNDLETHTSRLLDIAQRQNSYTLRVEAYHIRIITLWLQAQHSKLDINIQNARRLLQEARELAESHGLVKLATKISNQNEKMLDQLENWDEFIRKYYEFIKTG